MTNGESKIVPSRSRVTLDAEVSDGQLLGRFNVSRDELGERAFAVLVGRHGPMVLRVCHQILGNRDGAEDAFQATFLVLARKSGAIRRPELLANWLYGVALRTAWEAKMRDGQRRRREVSTAETTQDQPTRDADRPELTLICREEYQVLHEEVSRLPERYRLPVVLCELEGLTYQEAAQRLRCPIGTIGVRREPCAGTPACAHDPTGDRPGGRTDERPPRRERQHGLHFARAGSVHGPCGRRFRGERRCSDGPRINLGSCPDTGRAQTHGACASQGGDASGYYHRHHRDSRRRHILPPRTGAGPGRAPCAGGVHGGRSVC